LITRGGRGKGQTLREGGGGPQLVRQKRKNQGNAGRPSPATDGDFTSRVQRRDAVGPSDEAPKKARPPLYDTTKNVPVRGGKKNKV